MMNQIKLKNRPVCANWIAIFVPNWNALLIALQLLNCITVIEYYRYTCVVINCLMLL